MGGRRSEWSDSSERSSEDGRGGAEQSERGEATRDEQRMMRKSCPSLTRRYAACKPPKESRSSRSVSRSTSPHAVCEPVRVVPSHAFAYRGRRAHPYVKDGRNHEGYGREPMEGHADTRPSKSLFLFDLPHWLNEVDLIILFEHFDVVQVDVISDRQSGSGTGYGFVSFTTIEEAMSAHRTMRGIMIGDVPIRVNYTA